MDAREQGRRTAATECAIIAKFTQGVALEPFHSCGCGKAIAARIAEKFGLEPK